ncbi:MAG: serine/threonine-protein kinase [Polyangiaceae bacterium]
MTATLSFPPRYVPLTALGKGGGGEVWAVRDRITGKTAALKTLREGAHDREVMALVREAAALSGVEGLGVPRVLRFGRLPGSEQPYLVRELVEGDSLANLIASGGDALAALEAVAQAADKVTRLHRALLLHGDIKPANIIVGEGGQATLVDLGLAASFREDGVRPEGITPRYAAPELLEGSPLTVRAEVFALGATIAELLATHRRRLPKDALAAFDEVVARATAGDPDARYPSADELKSALERALRAARGDASNACARGGRGELRDRCVAHRRPRCGRRGAPLSGSRASARGRCGGGRAGRLRSQRAPSARGMVARGRGSPRGVGGGRQHPHRATARGQSPPLSRMRRRRYRAASHRWAREVSWSSSTTRTRSTSGRCPGSKRCGRRAPGSSSSQEQRASRAPSRGRRSRCS